jgi:hypothetical protein
LWIKNITDHTIFATIVKVKSLKCVALKEIPNTTITWKIKKA